jgi:hypothetical protein
MGQKKPENGLEIAPAEEERALEENKETSEVRTIPYIPHNLQSKRIIRGQLADLLPVV